MMTLPASAALGFGIVGVGVIANHHARAIKAAAENHNLRLVGVMAPNAERANDFAQRHEIPFCTNDIDELMARADIQVICIASPSGAHLEPALKAIYAGKHVVVEKPLEINLDRVDTMIAAAITANVTICAIFQARFSRGARALKHAIENGRFGRLALCSAYVKWHRNVDYYRGWKGTLNLDGGGAVMNQAIHAVDLLIWLAGMPIEVSARTTRRVHGNIEAEDTACAHFQFANGALGGLEATTATYPGWGRRIEICGEFGCAMMEDDQIVRWDFKDVQDGDAELMNPLYAGEGGSGALAPEKISFYGHQLQIEELANAIRTGSKLTVEVEEARNAVALVRAIYDSANSKQAILLPR